MLTSDDLGAGVLLLDAQRLFDGDLIEGVHHPLDAVFDVARAITRHAELDLGIRNTLCRAQNLHVRGPFSQPIRRAIGGLPHS